MKPLSENETRTRRPPADLTLARTLAGLGRAVDAVTPWLLDLGSWTFGSMIAFNLVVLGALLTVGPVDAAVKIATAAFAVALPLGVGGLVLLRLLADMSKANVGEATASAFVSVGFSFERAAETDAHRSRRIALLCTYTLLAATVLLTLIGVTAALWHMAWWIGVVFIVMALVSQSVVIGALSGFGQKGRWRAPSGEVEPPG